MRNCTVLVDPDAGVGAEEFMTCVVAVASVDEAPRQQLFDTNVEPLTDPQSVVPFPLKTADTSVVFDALTENPN